MASPNPAVDAANLCDTKQAAEPIATDSTGKLSSHAAAKSSNETAASHGPEVPIEIDNFRAEPGTYFALRTDAHEYNEITRACVQELGFRTTDENGALLGKITLNLGFLEDSDDTTFQAEFLIVEKNDQSQVILGSTINDEILVGKRGCFGYVRIGHGGELGRFVPWIFVERR